MYITLEQAKKHLLVDEDFRADDMYILDLIAVAEDSVSKHLDIALDELETGGNLPPAIIHAMLLMIGNLYDVFEKNIEYIDLNLIGFPENYKEVLKNNIK